MSVQLLRPSSYDRWSKCLASVYRENLESPSTSAAASVGTQLHAQAALAITSVLCGTNPVIDNPLVQAYIDALISRYRIQTEESVYVEQKVDLSEWLGTAAVGTSDLFVVSGSRLEVHDFKSGRIEVFAKDNGQLMLYALGVAMMLDGVGLEIDEILLVIHQPLVKSEPDEHTLTLDELIAFGEHVKDISNRIVQDPLVSATPGEVQCRWCPHAWRCKELGQFVQEQVEGKQTDVASLGKRFVNLPIIEGYVKAIEGAVKPKDVQLLALRVIAVTLKAVYLKLYLIQRVFKFLDLTDSDP